MAACGDKVKETKPTEPPPPKKEEPAPAPEPEEPAPEPEPEKVPEPEPVREPEPVIECAFGQELIGDKCELVVLEGKVECLIDRGAFCAETLMVKKGTEIKWKVIERDLGAGGDVDYHQVFEINGLFDSGQLVEGRSWKYTFNEIGEFNYICPPHGWMVAKIIVVE